MMIVTKAITFAKIGRSMKNREIMAPPSFRRTGEPVPGGADSFLLRGDLPSGNGLQEAL